MYRIIIVLLILTIDIFAYQGVGYGKNRQEAINLALSDIASQISILVDSSTTINKRATNSDYTKEVQSMIHTKIPKISFQNYYIVEERQDKNYFVRLEVDSKALASTYAKKLDRELKSISQQLNAYSSKFKKYSILKKVQIERLFLSMELICAIDSTYDIGSFKSQIEELTQKRDNYIKSLSFQVVSNNQQVKEVAEELLNSMGLVGSPNGNIEFSINLGKIVKQKFDGQYTGKTYATVKIVENGKTILSRRVKLFGQTYISQEYLMDRILKKLEKKLDEILKEIL